MHLLDRKTEHAYQEFRATLKRFINKNAKLDNEKIAPDYDQVRSLRAREEVSNGFCKLPEYLVLKGMLQELLQREATFRERLERSVDPTEGECLLSFCRSVAPHAMMNLAPGIG